MNDQNSYDHSLRDKLSRLPVPDVQKTWPQMRMLLDEEMPEGGRSRRRGGWWFYTALLIFIIAGSWTVMTFNFSKQNVDPPLSATKNTSPPTAEAGIKRGSENEFSEKSDVADDKILLKEELNNKNETNPKPNSTVPLTTNTAPNGTDGNKPGTTEARSAPTGQKPGLVATSRIETIKKVPDDRPSASDNGVGSNTARPSASDNVVGSNTARPRAGNNGVGSNTNPLAVSAGRSGITNVPAGTINGVEAGDNGSKINGKSNTRDKFNGISASPKGNGTSNAPASLDDGSIIPNNKINLTGANKQSVGSSRIASKETGNTDSKKKDDSKIAGNADQKPPAAMSEGAQELLEASSTVGLTRPASNSFAEKIDSIKADPSSHITYAPVSRKYYRQNKKYGRPVNVRQPYTTAGRNFAIGLSLPLAFPLGDQKALGYNRNAGPNTVSDYIPAPHAQYHFNAKAYLQSELQLMSPQFIKPALLYQNTTSNNF